MKKLFVTFALAFALIGQNLQGAEKYKTLVCNAATPTATYNVPAGELCHVLYVMNAQRDSANNDIGQLSATIQGTIFSLVGYGNVGGRGQFHWYRSGAFVGPKNLMIAGPATITLTRRNNNDNFCTLRLIPTPNIGGVGQ